MDSDIGNFEKKGTRRKIVCFVCGYWLLGLTDFYKNISKGQSCEPF